MREKQATLYVALPMSPTGSALPALSSGRRAALSRRTLLRAVCLLLAAASLVVALLHRTLSTAFFKELPLPAQRPESLTITISTARTTNDSQTLANQAQSTAAVSSTSGAPSASRNASATPVSPKVTNGSISVSVWPDVATPAYDPDERFLGFLPHSGFHNQRIQLQNAMILATMLNRTLLMPPIWVGWPATTREYTSLQAVWSSMSMMLPASFNISIDEPEDSFLPAGYPTSALDFPLSDDDAKALSRQQASIAKVAEANRQAYKKKGWKLRPDGFPAKTNWTVEECKSYRRECRWTYQDTFLAWDWLVDLPAISRATQGRFRYTPRWDMRERSIMNMTGATKQDVYVIQDEQAHDFRFTVKSSTPAELINQTPDGKYRRQVSIQQLGELPHKVLLFGSLFGSNKLVLDQVSNKQGGAFFGRHLAFRNPWLADAAQDMVARLGGSGAFLGVHARVAEQKFRSQGRSNMLFAWDSLASQLGIADTVKLEALKLADDAKASLAHEFNKLRESPKAATVAVTASPSPSKLHDLQCRGKLHTDAALALFNTPLYLATDSRSPVDDEVLDIFFKTFPCVFILDDFKRDSGAIARLESLVNEHDGVKLGRLLIPFLEAMIAAMGVATVGTNGSTFSAFAASYLHEAYHKQPPFQV